MKKRSKRNIYAKPFGQKKYRVIKYHTKGGREVTAPRWRVAQAAKASGLTHSEFYGGERGYGAADNSRMKKTLSPNSKIGGAHLSANIRRVTGGVRQGRALGRILMDTRMAKRRAGVRIQQAMDAAMAKRSAPKPKYTGAQIRRAKARTKWYSQIDSGDRMGKSFSRREIAQGLKLSKREMMPKTSSPSRARALGISQHFSRTVPANYIYDNAPAAPYSGFGSHQNKKILSHMDKRKAFAAQLKSARANKAARQRVTPTSFQVTKTRDSSLIAKKAWGTRKKKYGASGVTRAVMSKRRSKPIVKKFR